MLSSAHTPVTAPDGGTVPGRRRNLLFAGLVAGPLYVVVSLIEAGGRDGFDPARHAWSMLANGPFGWVHSVNLVVSGALVVAGAAGLSQVLRDRMAAGLLALYGAGMVGAGLFRADPGRGFPAGTPEVTPMSWHGILHFVVGGIGFLALFGVCHLLGRRLRRENHPQMAIFSHVTGTLFLVLFIAMAATGGASWALFAFTGAVIVASAWLSTIFAHYRHSF
ncbi:DUF998 domain-containing protein [Actinoplanes hulinensis]|uniref:DUF998 domain-containing protein n=1 Tax=Actinoplanes hulinensis TaxID=1144547 RepID=A0ABS7BE93_9ACTN|nr:DUF998 domain-containing protein [Actinoplanes hulinensis]MBW6439197.1 DUF998 domain-containing protein [Actinoplanes hulinensis]